MNSITKLFHWWVGPNLPDEYLFLSPANRPKELYSSFRIYLRQFIVHPVKRRIAKYYLVILSIISDIKVIGITGSAGKTTTKEMASSILERMGLTVASFANIDPIYNIPSTILRCRTTTKYLVLEMGVEYPGEMDFYLWLAKPDIGILTNVFPTHTQFFKDVNGVLNEKSKLIKFLTKGDTAILNADERKVMNLKNETEAEVIEYGKSGSVKAVNIKRLDTKGTIFTLYINKDKIDVHIPNIGNQFVSNALAAASIGFACGVKLSDIAYGLKNYERAEHRMQILTLRNGALLIDDTYNNNPEAAKATLSTFQEISTGRKKIIVFGDMLELGNQERQYHRKLGKFIGEIGADLLICTGPLTKETYKVAKLNIKIKQAKWFIHTDKVYNFLKANITSNSAILVKGSRSLKLEDKIVQKLSLL